MNIRERILKYLEFKGISRYKFYKEAGLSNGFLDKIGSIGSDKCEKICYQYPDISPEWLLTGKGSMLKEGLKDESKEQLHPAQEGDFANDNTPAIIYLSQRNEVLTKEKTILSEENKHLRQEVKRLTEENTQLQQKIKELTERKKNRSGTKVIID